MNIIINQKKLLTAIRSVERIVSKNNSLPILGGILLTTEGGRLCLTTTNLELGIHYWVGAKVEKEGSLVVPVRVFSEFINSLQDEKVHMVVEKNILTISTDNYTTQILGMKTDEFPLIPKIKATHTFMLPSRQFSGALASVADSTALLETRPELSGVYVGISGSELVCAATDSFRLSECVVKATFPMEKSIILPRSTVLEVMRITSDRDEEIAIHISENQIAFQGSDFELVSRLIDGHYPDYKKIIPERFAATLVIAKDELERAVRTAGIFSSAISDLTIKVDAQGLHISARNTDKGEILSTVPVQSGKAAFSVSLNYRYLLDGLKVIPGNRVMLGYSGEGAPIVLKEEKEAEHTYVIMPLRTS